MAKTSSPFSFKAISATKMPREQRDTLFILGTLLFILLPHFFYLPIWASVLTCLTLLWRAWLTRGTAKLPGLLIKISLLVFFVGATLISYKTIAGPQAGGTLLVMLVSLKTLELRARRDALIIFYLGFFLIMMSFFESQNILIALCMLISLTALMDALINPYAGRVSAAQRRYPHCIAPDALGYALHGHSIFDISAPGPAMGFTRPQCGENRRFR